MRNMTRENQIHRIARPIVQTQDHDEACHNVITTPSGQLISTRLGNPSTIDTNKVSSRWATPIIQRSPGLDRNENSSSNEGRKDQNTMIQRPGNKHLNLRLQLFQAKAQTPKAFAERPNTLYQTDQYRFRRFFTPISTIFAMCCGTLCDQDQSQHDTRACTPMDFTRLDDQPSSSKATAPQSHTSNFMKSTAAFKGDATSNPVYNNFMGDALQTEASNKHRGSRKQQYEVASDIVLTDEDSSSADALSEFPSPRPKHTIETLIPAHYMKYLQVNQPQEKINSQPRVERETTIHNQNRSRFSQLKSKLHRKFIRRDRILAFDNDKYNGPGKIDIDKQRLKQKNTSNLVDAEGNPLAGSKIQEAVSSSKTTWSSDSSSGGKKKKKSSIERLSHFALEYKRKGGSKSKSKIGPKKSKLFRRKSKVIPLPKKRKKRGSASSIGVITYVSSKGHSYKEPEVRDVQLQLFQEDGIDMMDLSEILQDVEHEDTIVGGVQKSTLRGDKFFKREAFAVDGNKALSEAGESTKSIESEVSLPHETTIVYRPKKRTLTRRMKKYCSKMWRKYIRRNKSFKFNTSLTSLEDHYQIAALMVKPKTPSISDASGCSTPPPTCQLTDVKSTDFDVIEKCRQWMVGSMNYFDTGEIDREDDMLVRKPQKSSKKKRKWWF